MIAVGVGVHHASDTPRAAAVFSVDLQPSRSALAGYQMVHDDDSLFTLDNRHVREIESPDLVDALADPV